MLGFSDFWFRSAENTLTLDELFRVEEFLAAIALVSSGLLVLTKRADTLDVAVGEENAAFGAEALLHLLLGKVVIFVEI